jgi:hypothetical protein
MAFAARFVGGPLNGQVFSVPKAPSTLYARRAVGAAGMIHLPASHQGPDALRAGAYRRGADPLLAGRFVYRFEG